MRGRAGRQSAPYAPPRRAHPRLASALCSGTSPPPAGEECFYRPPYHNLRHPFIFYYGHVAVFYVNKLRVAGIQAEPLNLHFEQIFEVCARWGPGVGGAWAGALAGRGGRCRRRGVRGHVRAPQLALPRAAL